MAEAAGRTPWGPWTDYCRHQNAAEDAAGIVIDQILTDGGTVLWQKYLERKAFGFAANAVSDALVSEMNMCFVCHDQGEGELGSDWELEEEPLPSEIDSWARMYLPVRRQTIADFVPGTATSSKARTGEVRKMGASMRSRASDRQKSAKSDKRANEKVEPRSAPLPDEFAVDEEEDRLRDGKVQEEARRRDKDRRAKEMEKTKDEERRKVQALHEEMSKRAHTFDTDGNIIWVEETKPERLPKVQETFPFSIKKDRNRTGALEDMMKSTTSLTGKLDAPDSPSSPKRSTRRGLPKAREPKKPPEPEFTDGFSKQDIGQPPILETMMVQSGVTLELQGKKKQGLEDAHIDRQMSRKEYVQMAEREVAMDGSHKGPSDPYAVQRAAAARESPSARQQPGGGFPGAGPSVAESTGDAGYPAGGNGGFGQQASAQELGGGTFGPGGGAGGGGGQGGTSLPPIDGRQGSRAPAGGGGLMQGSSNVSAGASQGARRQPDSPGPLQKAPRPPPMYVRGRKGFEARGFAPHPRYHAPLLGGPTGYGPAHPPIGATMGHGLVRHGSLKEDYFFPSPVPELPAGLMKSSSEAGLGSGRRSLLEPSKMSSREEEIHGRMNAESMSPAYRNFRHALFPPDASTGSFGRAF